jgi:hypothetical protein
VEEAPAQNPKVDIRIASDWKSQIGIIWGKCSIPTVGATVMMQLDEYAAAVLCWIAGGRILVWSVIRCQLDSRLKALLIFSSVALLALCIVWTARKKAINHGLSYSHRNLPRK